MSNYSAFTLRNYECSIRVIMNTLSFKEDDILTKPNDVIAYINTLESLNTKNSRYNSIKWFIKGKCSSEVYKAYNDAHEALKNKRQEQLESQQLKESRAENYLEWPQVLALTETMEFKVLSELEQIVYYLYTLMPPVRADFVGMKVLTEKDYNNMLTICPNLNDYNWCLLDKHLTPSKFIFNKYKTDKTYGKVILDIPKKLANELYSYRAGVRLNEFELLPINTENALCKMVQRIFEKLSGKRMSIGLLRHSYIHHFLSVKRKISERKELSRQMMHSIEVQEQYDVI